MPVFKCLFVWVLFAGSLFGQQTNLWKKAKIELDGQSIQTLLDLGLACDHGHHIPHQSFEGDFTQEELAKIENAGLKYKSVPRKKTELRSGPFNCNPDQVLPPKYQIPSNYEFGSMGGFSTLDELYANLDLMRELYPKLISVKKQIGNFTTFENRPIYFLKISDNPDSDESDEPQVLYTALHHAREPISMSQMLFFMWTLLENYGRDPEIKRLVDNRELYFVPCLNPDGYAYNELQSPFGGGNWRKNVRPNTEGIGTDLNRNYGLGWAVDNNGSSPSGGSETFRGAGAFSESETKAMKYLCATKEFRIALNYHAFGDYLIIPWGYLDRPTEDSVQYLALANDFTKFNKFQVGTTQQTLAYGVNGVSDDWMYGAEDLNQKILAFTPEVGYAFWPERRDILTLNQSTQYMNFRAAWCAGECFDAQEISPRAIETDSLILQLQVQQLGVVNGTIAVNVTTDYSGLKSTSGESTYHIDPNEVKFIDLPFHFSKSPHVGDSINFEITISSGSYVQVIKATKVFKGLPAFKEECTQIDRWFSVTAQSWTLTEEDYTSEPSCFTDSPNGPLKEGQTLRLQSWGATNLGSSKSAYLSFRAKWDLSADADYVQIKASSDGNNFKPLCGVYTRQGTNFQDLNNPLYAGTQEQWVSEWIDLSEYLGKHVFLELYFNSTFSGVPHDGFYIDDIKIYAESLTGTQEPIADKIRLEPNPANDVLHIRIEDFKISQIQEYNFQLSSPDGKKWVAPLRTADGGWDLEVSHLPKGLYILHTGRNMSQSHSLHFIVN